jgi:nucleoside-diphosphate-sugar epimerase
MRAADGATSIVHLAASLRGSPDTIRSSCIDGTQNVADAARAAGCRRVIHVSSMAIYDFATFRNGEKITEASPLERFPEERGTATEGKCRAEQIAVAHLGDASPSWTILRPSFIVGNGRNPFQAIGYKVGSTLVAIGSRRRHLRLIHVADIANAICVTLADDATTGRIFVVSDGESVRAEDYLTACVPRDSLRIIHVPYWTARAITTPLRLAHKLTGRGPNVNLRRLKYLFNDTTADSLSFNDVTGWRPKGNLLQRLAAEVTV